MQYFLQVYCFCIWYICGIWSILMMSFISFVKLNFCSVFIDCSSAPLFCDIRAIKTSFSYSYSSYFLNGNSYTLIEISMKFIPKGPFTISHNCSRHCHATEMTQNYVWDRHQIGLHSSFGECYIMRMMKMMMNIQQWEVPSITQCKTISIYIFF